MQLWAAMLEVKESGAWTMLHVPTGQLLEHEAHLAKSSALMSIKQSHSCASSAGHAPRSWPADGLQQSEPALPVQLWAATLEVQDSGN